MSIKKIYKKANNNKKEDNTMAVLSKPVNLSFELSPNEATKFFKNTDKNALKKAIERASRHNPIVKK